MNLGRVNEPPPPGIRPTPSARAASFSHTFQNPNDTTDASPGITATPTHPHPQQQHHYDPTWTMIRSRASLVGDTTTGTMIGLINSSNNDHDETRDIRLSADDDTMLSDRIESVANENIGISQPLYSHHQHHNQFTDTSTTTTTATTTTTTSTIPAVILITLFHLMIGIPFGVSYFPIGWGNTPSDSSSNDENDNNIQGTFPLQNKEALGIRMFLFSTIIGQVVFTLRSGFDSPIGLQMVENVPFCHALSKIVIQHQGYGRDALSTIMVLFGLSSILVGIVFYTLGRLKLGRIVYYFPNHVLVGCIGGIGIFIAKTGCEVTTNSVLTVNMTAIWQFVTEHVHLLIPLVFFETSLRILQRLLVNKEGTSMFPLLAPVYFISITPMFYLILWIGQVDWQYANSAGFFFPSLLTIVNQNQNQPSPTSVIFGGQLLDMWSVIDVRCISWPAVWDAVPTMVALTLFSLIHVPINIPAYAVSTDAVADMNKELIAHGYSNVISGLCGGLQNYFAYTQSVLYHRSGGHGTWSGLVVAACTAGLFVFGPQMTSYIPRCMAGTLLLHVGIDLFLEGVYDSIGKFDYVEYAGIWLITIVMTTLGMEAAMIAGGVAAVSTHAVQSVHYVNPIRGSMTASTLRSSRWNRTNQELKILDDESVGRNRILVIQVQSHLFFGNMAQFMETINQLFLEKASAGYVPWIVLLDFSLVLGIDSSAAQAMTKLSDNLRISFGADLCIFVTGSDAGFPCEFNLSKELLSRNNSNVAPDVAPDESTVLLLHQHESVDKSITFRGNHIEQSLDLALAFAEDCLLYRQGICLSKSRERPMHIPSSERELALAQIANISPAGIDFTTIELLFSNFQRETYEYDDLIWNQGSQSDCVKLLIEGQLIARLENEAGTTEIVHAGNMVGELGLLQGLPRMSSLKCYSDKAVLYSLSGTAFELLCQRSPEAARLLDLICIRYLSNRVQHVSNRIFETRCLPI